LAHRIFLNQRNPAFVNIQASSTPGCREEWRPDPQRSGASLLPREKPKMAHNCQFPQSKATCPVVPVLMKEE
jgi:hypothetical protein